MTIDVSIDSVKTEDATPEEAPFKISDKLGKDTLIFDFTVTADDIIRCWKVRFEPVNRITGQILDGRGMVCGTGDRCGSPIAFSLEATAPLEVTEEIEEAQVHAHPDGDYPIEVFAMQDGEWNS